MFKIGKFIETENKLVVAWGQRGGYSEVRVGIRGGGMRNDC